MPSKLLPPRYLTGLIIILTIPGQLLADWRQSPYGLHHSPEEIAVWRERAGLDDGERMYRVSSDVQPNSPGDWLRVWGDGDSAVTDPGNDRFTNYDVTQGLDSPITELNSPWIRDNSWPARVPFIDAKEPRPNIDRQDYAAISVMNAGWLYLLAGDDGRIARRKGAQYAAAVRDELLHYANDEWLDFTNESRWLRNDNGFGDRNPGFFIACWVNTLVNAYDYTRTSSVYADDQRAMIEAWLFHAIEFFRDLKLADIDNNFPNYEETDYTVVNDDDFWWDRPRGPAWQGSELVSYGFNEAFSNRSTVQWRLIMRGGLLFRDHEEFGEQAREMVRQAHRWLQEWVVFGCFKDGTFSDFHRGGASRPQTGLTYASIAIGAAIDMADAYERLWRNEPDFASLYEFEMNYGDELWQTMATPMVQDRPWYPHFFPDEGESISFKQVLRTYGNYFDGTFGNTRRWNRFNIDGKTQRQVDEDRWLAPAATYYARQDPQLAAYLRSIYTREAEGTVDYAAPGSIYAGSYPIDIGSWAGHPATLLMFGKMDGQVWPYGSVGALDNPFRYARLDEDGWRHVAWLGWLFDERFPSIYHLDHGWLYVHPASATDAVSFYDQTLGWIWTSAAAPDFFFRHETGEWLYYLRGTHDPRWFFNFERSEWVAIPTT